MFRFPSRIYMFLHTEIGTVAGIVFQFTAHYFFQYVVLSEKKDDLSGDLSSLEIVVLFNCNDF